MDAIGEHAVIWTHFAACDIGGWAPVQLSSILLNRSFRPAATSLRRGWWPQLGQVLTMRPNRIGTGPWVRGPEVQHAGRLARGEGVILDGTCGRSMTPWFGRPNLAKSDAWLERVRPNRSALEIGELLLAPGVAAALDSGGFNRHTFMCGQSGSGRPTRWTGARAAPARNESAYGHLDPNSDYIRLSEVREGADPAVAAEYAAAASGVSVWQNDPGATNPLQLQFLDIDPRRKPPSSDSIPSVIERSTPRCQKFLLPAKRAAL